MAGKRGCELRMTGCLFCFGLGYTASRLARRLAARGFEIRGTSREGGIVRLDDGTPVRTLAFRRGHPLPDPEAALRGVTHLLVSIPPDERGDPVLDHHLEDLRRLPDLVWVGYLGTTAVYGDRQGGWVSEEDPPAPTLPRAHRRLAAERAWLASGLPVHLFRLSGIYGPGRNVLRQLREGRAHRIVKPGQLFSRIHVEDLVSALEASLQAPRPGRIYNLADDDPAPPQDVVTFAARLLSVAPPPEQPFETARLTAAQRSFYRDCRRVRNDRMKRELGVRLRYPTYREGLRALLPIECAADHPARVSEG